MRLRPVGTYFKSYTFSHRIKARSDLKLHCMHGEAPIFLQLQMIVGWPPDGQ